MASRVLPMDWVLCKVDRCCSRPIVVAGNDVKYITTMRLFWPVHWTQTDSTRVWHLKHSLGSFLTIAPIQHRLSQFSPAGQVLGTIKYPSFIGQNVQLGSNPWGTWQDIIRPPCLMNKMMGLAPDPCFYSRQKEEVVSDWSKRARARATDKKKYVPRMKYGKLLNDKGSQILNGENNVCKMV
ncbi:hypothetical protein TNCV_3462761 [Trichonephila clavipes]|nr:hypothetical protein TNCV_3462761 [Trichonephila clavipes]